MSKQNNALLLMVVFLLTAILSAACQPGATVLTTPTQASVPAAATHTPKPEPTLLSIPGPSLPQPSADKLATWSKICQDSTADEAYINQHFADSLGAHFIGHGKVLMSEMNQDKWKYEGARFEYFQTAGDPEYLICIRQTSEFAFKYDQGVEAHVPILNVALVNPKTLAISRNKTYRGLRPESSVVVQADTKVVYGKIPWADVDQLVMGSFISQPSLVTFLKEKDRALILGDRTFVFRFRLDEGKYEGEHFFMEIQPVPGRVVASRTALSADGNLVARVFATSEFGSGMPPLKEYAQVFAPGQKEKVTRAECKDEFTLSLGFTQDGETLILGYSAGNAAAASSTAVKIYQVERGSQWSECKTRELAVDGKVIAISPGAGLAAVEAAAGSGLRVRDLNKPAAGVSLNVTGTIEQAVFLGESGLAVAIAGDQGETIAVFSPGASDPYLILALNRVGELLEMTSSPDGSLLAVHTTSGMAVVDLVKKQVLQNYGEEMDKEHWENFYVKEADTRFSPDNHYLYFISSGEAFQRIEPVQE